MASSGSESTLSSGASSRSISISVPGAYPLFEQRLCTAARLPQGLAAAVEALAREVLRERPNDIYSFAAQHFDYLVQSRTGEWISAGKKECSESKRFCYIEGDRSVVNRGNPAKKKCSKNGWSLGGTSRILRKPAMFSSEMAQGHIDCAEHLLSERSKIARTSCQLPSNVSLFSETDVNAPSIIGDSVGKLTTAEDVGPSSGSTGLPSQSGQTMRPRSGSFELVELVDSRHAEGRARLLRSISFDSILPTRSESMLSDEIDGKSIIPVTTRSNSASRDADVPPPLRTKVKNNNDKKKTAGSAFLPAVKSPWLPPSVATPISATWSSRSTCLPHSCQDQSLEGYRSRGDGTDLALPLIKYELPKSGKKCDYPLLVLPAVVTNTGAGPAPAPAPVPAEPFQVSTRDLQGFAEKDGRTATKAELDLEEESLEESETTSATTNELGKKLYALQLVERKIERSLVLGGGIFGKTRFTRDQPIEEMSAGNESLEKANERATRASDQVSGVMRKASTDLQEEECKGGPPSQLSEREVGDITDNSGGPAQLCDDDPFTINNEHSTGQLEQVVGGGCPSYKNQDIGDLVSAAGRIELDEIMEEEIEEEESLVGRSDYESRVVRSTMLGQNRAAGRTNPANNKNSRALEDILEKEEKEEGDVPENGRVNFREIEKLSVRPEINEDPPNGRTNRCDALAYNIIASSPAGSLLPAAVTKQDETVLEEQTAKELIEADGHCILKKAGPSSYESENGITRLQETSCPHQQSTEPESERSLDGGCPVLRVCHTGEFHDSLPLHLLQKVGYSNFTSRDLYPYQDTSHPPSESGDGQSMSTWPDSMLQKQKQKQKQEQDDGQNDRNNTALCQSKESGNGNSASVLAPSNNRGAFDREEVSASSEQPLALSTGSFSGDFPSQSVSKFMQPITFCRIPQDGVASCTVIRAVGTNLGGTGFPPSLIYMFPSPSYSHSYPCSSYTMELAIAVADAYKHFQDRTSGGGGGDSVPSTVIEEIPNFDTPEEKIQGRETRPIDSLARSTPSSSAGTVCLSVRSNLKL